MTKLCDGCRISNAAIYCTADMAYICLGCDLKVHGANKLASRHERVWICEVCEHAPAAVICKADAAALCPSCDTDIHSANPLANRHERVAVTPFFECPSMIKVAHINANSVQNLFPSPECWPHQHPASFGGFTTAGMYPPAGSGLENLDSFLGTNHNHNIGGFIQEGHDSLGAGTTTTTYSMSQTKSSSFAAVPETSSSMSDISKPYPGNMIEFLCQFSNNGEQGMPKPGIAREERVLRYKEKRKNRKFEKTVRYASRKAYAEIRPRIKGRFVKRTEVEHFVLSAMADSVVPSF